MVTPRQFRTAILPIFALLTLATAIGCESLQSNTVDPLTAGDITATVTDPMVVVELHAGSDKCDYLRAPLKDSMLVQDALKGSGAIQRFRRMDIVLVRPVSGGETLRLPVRYDSSARSVLDEHNYTLHGGDVLEVTQDTSTTLDRMIDHALQPLRPVLRGHGH